MGRKIEGFEVINNAGFRTENLFGKLINEEEIKRRLEHLTDRTLKMACDGLQSITKNILSTTTQSANKPYKIPVSPESPPQQLLLKICLFIPQLRGLNSCSSEIDTRGCGDCFQKDSAIRGCRKKYLLRTSFTFSPSADDV